MRWLSLSFFERFQKLVLPVLRCEMPAVGIVELDLVILTNPRPLRSCFAVTHNPPDKNCTIISLSPARDDCQMSGTSKRTNCTTGISGRQYIRRQIARHHAAGPNDRVLANRHAGADDHPSSQPHTVAYNHRMRGFQP